MRGLSWPLEETFRARCLVAGHLSRDQEFRMTEESGTEEKRKKRLLASAAESVLIDSSGLANVHFMKLTLRATVLSREICFQTIVLIPRG